MKQDILLTGEQWAEVKKLQTEKGLFSEPEAVEEFKGWQPFQYNFVLLANGTPSQPKEGMIIRFV